MMHAIRSVTTRRPAARNEPARDSLAPRPPTREPRSACPVLILTCRQPEIDFRRPLTDALVEFGCDVTYVFLKRHPEITTFAGGIQRKSVGLTALLKHLRREFRGRDDLLVLNSTNLVFPLLSALIRAVVGGTWLFDMHDDLLYSSTGWTRRRKWLAQRALLLQSDGIVHAAPTLQELFPSSRHIGNASSISPAVRPSPSFDRVLILASLDERIDLDLLRRTAEAMPAVSFDIWGGFSVGQDRIRAAVAALVRETANVAYKGPYGNADIADLTSRYHVTFSPYRTNAPLTRYIDPLRFYHCLNAGMEVVSTRIPRALDLAGHLHLADSPEDVRRSIETIAADPAARKSSTWNWRENDWTCRARSLLEVGETFAKGGP